MGIISYSLSTYYNFYHIVLPKIQANNAGAADALMLDADGFVSETNATNVFMVKNGQIFTPHADYCLPGNFIQLYIQQLFYYFRSRNYSQNNY